MSILKQKVITQVNNGLANKLREAGYNQIGSCIQCGTCTGSCPSGRRTSLKIRTIIRKVQLGIDDVLSDNDIWYCSTCYTCFERCPRNVPVTDMIIFLRNLAVQKGFMLKSHLELCQKLLDTGHGVPIDSEKWNNLRKFYGLSKIPPTVHSHPDSLDEIQKLLILSEFDKLIMIKPKDIPLEESLEVLNVIEDGVSKLVVKKISSKEVILEKEVKVSVC